ncbi:MAG: hypothetical protein AAFS02_04890 [Pseudomonadota bacterium]
MATTAFASEKHDPHLLQPVFKLVVGMACADSGYLAKQSFDAGVCRGRALVAVEYCAEHLEPILGSLKQSPQRSGSSASRSEQTAASFALLYCTQSFAGTKPVSRNGEHPSNAESEADDKRLSDLSVLTKSVDELSADSVEALLRLAANSAYWSILAESDFILAKEREQSSEFASVQGAEKKAILSALSEARVWQLNKTGELVFASLYPRLSANGELIAVSILHGSKPRVQTCAEPLNYSVPGACLLTQSRIPNVVVSWD